MTHLSQILVLFRADAATFEKQLLDYCSKRTRRSIDQTKFLYDLVGNDWTKLLKLEEAIKNNHISFCPETTDEVDEILNMVPKTHWFYM